MVVLYIFDYQRFATLEYFHAWSCVTFLYFWLFCISGTGITEHKVHQANKDGAGGASAYKESTVLQQIHRVVWPYILVCSFWSDIMSESFLSECPELHISSLGAFPEYCWNVGNAL